MTRGEKPLERTLLPSAFFVAAPPSQLDAAQPAEGDDEEDDEEEEDRKPLGSVCRPPTEFQSALLESSLQPGSLLKFSEWILASHGSGRISASRVF